MSEPLVSVKMITYNHAPYIAQAIEGVLMQKTNFPIELVIGEDCSTDGTREIVFEYQKKCPEIIRVITSDKNVGMKKNGYRTTKACRGKYIAFCEGDDYWHHLEKLQKQVDYMESHPECGLVYSSYDVYHPESGKLIKDFIKHLKWEIPKNLSASDILLGRDRHGFILTCTVMLRRNLHEQIVESDLYLYKSENFLMGDTQLWLEILTIAQVYFIPESLATHNITQESATRSRDETKPLRFTISGAELGFYLCNKYNLAPSVKNEFEESWCNSSLKLAFLTKNENLAYEVKRRKKIFTWKDWLRYYGAKNAALHYVYRAGAVLRNLFRKENNKWLS